MFSREKKTRGELLRFRSHDTPPQIGARALKLHMAELRTHLLGVEAEL